MFQFYIKRHGSIFNLRKNLSSFAALVAFLSLSIITFSIILLVIKNTAIFSHQTQCLHDCNQAQIIPSCLPLNKTVQKGRNSAVSLIKR